MERTPFVPDRGKHSPLLTLCTANVRAVKSKTAALLEYIHSADMDIFAVTKTWLTEKDAAAKMEFIPTETHKFVQCNRQGRRGGGTGLLFKKQLQVKHIESGEKSSFEFSEWRVVHQSLRAKLIIVYRPPYSAEHPVTPQVFFEEFGKISWSQTFCVQSP